MKFFSQLIVVATALLPSCNRFDQDHQAKPQPTTTRVDVRPASSCALESYQEYIGDGSLSIKAFHLKLRGLKAIKAQLQIASQGSLTTVQTIEYGWNEWQGNQEAIGDLLLSIQDGKPFGAEGKKLPKLVMDIQGAPPASVITTFSDYVLDGDLQPRLGKTANRTSNLTKSVLCSQVLSPINSNDWTVTLSDDPDSLATSSEGGVTIIAVVIEAIPQ